MKLLDLCQSLPEPITFVSRLRLDAALYEPPPPRKPSQPGRSRKKGERLPNLYAVAEDPDTEWEQITVHGWYGGQERTVEIVSRTALWYSPGEPAVPELCSEVVDRDFKGHAVYLPYEAIKRADVSGVGAKETPQWADYTKAGKIARSTCSASTSSPVREPGR